MDVHTIQYEVDENGLPSFLVIARHNYDEIGELEVSHGVVVAVEVKESWRRQEYATNMVKEALRCYSKLKFRNATSEESDFHYFLESLERKGIFQSGFNKENGERAKRSMNEQLGSPFGDMGLKALSVSYIGTCA